MLIEKLSNIFSGDGKSKTKEPHFKIFSDFNKESPGNNRISNVIDWAKEEGYLARLDISEDSAEVLLRSMLVEHDLPEELRNNAKLKNEIKQVTIEKAGESSPLSPDEIKQVHKLIESGEIFQDIIYSLNVIFSLITKPDRFFNLDESFKSYLKVVIELPGSIIADLDPRSAFDRISTQMKLIKSGLPPEDPEILINTMKSIYSAPEIGNTIDVINALLTPENETLRITLLVYARLNGINLEQQDINEVRATILDRENPRLGSLFIYIVTPENALRLAGR